MNYKFSTDFRKATDLMMADNINGKLINIIKKSSKVKLGPNKRES